MCDINANITLDCLDSAGSVVKVFVTNGPADSVTETAGNVTAISVGGSSLTPSDWFEFQVKPQTSVFTETANPSVENGTLFFQKDLTVSFPKMDAAKRNQLLLAAQNDKMIIVFLDANGLYWVLGEGKGGYTSAMTATTGQDYASKNGYDVTLSATELEPVKTIDSSIVVA
jgi:hypothetical protein